MGQGERTSGPRRQRELHIFQVDFDQTSIFKQSSQSGSDAQILSVLQGPHVLRAPSPQRMLIRERTVV